MVAKYSFNSQYRSEDPGQDHLPSLRLLEGGVFEPKEYSPVIVQEWEQMRLRFFQWGLPHAMSVKQAPVSSVAVGHLFSHAYLQQLLKSQRCLIPADGYYAQNQHQLYKLSKKDSSTFCFAGIYDQQTLSNGEMGQHFAIVSTVSNEACRPFGLQMPLILPKKYESLWLNPDTNAATLHRLLQHQFEQTLVMRLVEELQEISPLEWYPQVAA